MNLNPKNLVRQSAKQGLQFVMPKHRYVVNLRADSQALYLTFDDGPHPASTPRILDALKQHRAKATFFVIGQNAQRYPGVLRRIVEEGHAIGNHTYNHLQPGDVNPDRLIAEVKRTEAVVMDIVGEHTPLFRPPYGKLTCSKLIRLWMNQRTVVLWNKDPKDFECESAQEFRSRFRRCDLRAGDVVLLHDTSPVTAETIGDVLAEVSRVGLQCESLVSDSRTSE